jgi:peroxiredoxin Q/BCP
VTVEQELDIDFELPNVGAGPNPLSLAAVAEANEFVLLLFQRDYHCTNCRSQVQAVNDHYAEFRERRTEVVSIVPEPPDRLRGWQEKYDLPFPLCADPEAAVSERYDQPVRFGLLGSLSDFLGRMPKAVLLDCRGAEPTAAFSHEGSSAWDRPEIVDLLAAIDERR